MNLENNTRIYKDFYRHDNEMGMLIYSTINYILISYVTMLTNNVLIIEREEDGSFKLSLNEKYEKRSLEYLYSILVKFNNVSKSGELNKVFNLTNKYQEITGVLTAGTSAILLFVGIIMIIRECIFLYYYTRVKVSDYVRYLGNLVELNETTKSSNQMNIASKQSKIIDRIHELADKIDVDQKISVKMTEKEIKKSNSKMKNPDINYF
jgi:hypothetical protein